MSETTQPPEATDVGTTRAAPPPAHLPHAIDSPHAGKFAGHPDRPEFIGHYRILELLGEGGMGQVYTAEQREPVRRIVALKVIKLGMDTKEVLARFDAERQALALMNHPNVARVFEAGMTDAGRPYFAMEHVHGVPLTDYCDQAKLTTRERLDLFIPVCHAVQHAHQKGIIHRDLKPSNILVTVVDGKPVPKVIDFGIAKATNQQLTQHTLYTQTGALIGTPEYMSPEQAKTSGLDVDTRTDVYSLGVILYELLTGALPFDTETLHRAGYDGMARIIREQEPQKPSTRLGILNKTPTPRPGVPDTDEVARRRRCDLRTLQRQLRGDLDWIVLRAMEKDRVRRYETASALADDVHKYLNDEPVSAGPPGNIYRLTKFARRNRGVFVTGSIISVILVLGFFTSSIGFFNAKKANLKLASTNQELKIAQERAQSEAREAKQQSDQATKDRKEAQIALADSLLAQGDALDLAGHWIEAGIKYGKAYESFAGLSRPTFAAELGLFAHYTNSPPPLLTYTGSGGAVRCLAVSRDGRFAISGGEDRTIHVWDIHAGYEIRHFGEHLGQIQCIAISPDSRTAISGGDDNLIHLWNIDNGSQIRAFTGHNGPIFGVCFSPDGKAVFSASGDHTIKRWNAQTGAIERSTNIDVNDSVVAFSPDRQWALTGGPDRTFTRRDIRGDNPPVALKGQSGRIACIAISSDGKKAVTGSDDHMVQLWNFDTGDPPQTLRGHTDRVNSVAFSPDNSKLISASNDSTLKLWDTTTFTELRTLRGHGGRVLATAFVSDSPLVISGSDDKTLKLWDLQPDSEVLALRGHHGAASALAFAPHGRIALSGGIDNNLVLWDIATGLKIRQFAPLDAAVRGIAFSPDGKSAVAGDDAGLARIYDTMTGQEKFNLVGHTSSIQAVAFSPDGQSVLTASADGTIRQWDAHNGEPLRTFRGNNTDKRIICIAFEPISGGSFVSAGEGQQLLIWDFRTGKITRTLKCDMPLVLSVAFSSDGRFLAAGGDNGQIQVWDFAAGTPVQSFVGHAGDVIGVAFTPDDESILSGGVDGALKLWDTRSAVLIRNLARQAGPITSIALSSDGFTALSASHDDQAVRLWTFERGIEYANFLRDLPKAQEALGKNSNDPTAAAFLGKWYAFRGRDDWAIEQLIAARNGGEAIAPLLLARSNWRVGRRGQAVSEFTHAIEDTRDPQDKFYLTLCLDALNAPQSAER